MHYGFATILHGRTGDQQYQLTEKHKAGVWGYYRASIQVWNEQLPSPVEDQWALKINSSLSLQCRYHCGQITENGAIKVLRLN